MRRIKSTLLKVQYITPTIVEVVVVRRDGRDFFDFSPGQYATLSFPGHPILKAERSFSIVSTPTDRRTLRFGIRISGTYTSALRTVRAGDSVMVAGPFGQFTFSPALDRSAVFIAGGIGITPFLSMIQAATDLQLENDLVLFYSVRSLDDAAYKADLDALENNNPHFRALYAITDGNITTPSPNMFPGRINRERIGSILNGDVWNRTYFLCGPPAFMKAMTATLYSMGISRLAVKAERFGIGSQDFIERGTPVPKYVFTAWGIAAATLFGIIFRIEYNKRSVINVADTVTSGMISDTNSNTNVSATTLNSNTNFQAPSQPKVTNTVTNKTTNTRTATPSTTTAPQPVQPTPPPVIPRTTVS